MNNKSPLRYPGGKTRACKILDNIIQQYFKIGYINQIISPFLGGGSFEFYLQNKYKWNIVANDKFTPLYYFWKQVKTNKVELCKKLYDLHKQETTKEKFKEYRKLIMEATEKEQAIYFFIINRCSFSGATLSG